jgi:hypothetical protein
MWRHLLELYDESLLNEGHPKCLFAETEVFNEGWLLRSVLKEWKTSSRRSRFAFFRFPPDARVYSEGQLFTPFKVRPKSERTGDGKGEAHTHVDGIVGDFSIADGTKSGIELDGGCQCIAVFEAKLYSPISKGVTHAPKYDQVSRTAACLIHALLEAGPAAGCAAHVVVLYPEDNLDIKPEEYEKVSIRERIRKRLAEYKEAGAPTAEILRFEAGWEEMLGQVDVQFKTWEEVLAEIGDGDLNRFYELCKRFNVKR